MSRKHRRRDQRGLTDQESTSFRSQRGDREQETFGLNTGSRKAQVIKPRSPNQHEYFKYLESPHIDIVFAVGPAGTGKTLIAVTKAIESLKAGKIDRIVITRPAVSVDEEHGFLPGDLNAKMTPWTMPIFDIFHEHWSPERVKTMLKYEQIEIAPLAFMRGRTFKNCWIIADEMQNATPSQMKMLLTRIGFGSKFVITGDLTQHDRGYEHNGLLDFSNKFKGLGSELIRTVEFESCDIERHAVVAEILRIYDDSDSDSRIRIVR